MMGHLRVLPDAERKIHDIGKVVTSWHIMVAEFEQGITGINSVEYRTLKQCADDLEAILST